MLAIIKETNPPTTNNYIPIIENTTTVEEEEEFTIPSGMFDNKNEVTTSNITEEEEDKESNNYYDSIDNEIFRNEESTIVFEENSLAPATIRKDNPNNIIIEDLLTIVRFDMIVGLLNEDTVDFVIGSLSDLLDDHREAFRGILIEALVSINDVVDGAGVCDSLFALLDIDKDDDSHILGLIDYQ